jgi:plasmid stabilization system protein ParE
VATITWTLEAERWLQDIHDYIAADSPRAAAQTVEGIYERAQLLREFPQIGYRYEASERHVRILLYGHYRITYLVTEQDNIEILGVFHGALDIERYEL